MGKFALIISGPTASGKTDLSLKIAQHLPCEIINADVGQFYKPLTIGTAKPDWENSKVPHHLFDIISDPKNLSSFEFKNLILNSVDDVLARSATPIIVGGSLFYLKSLFFPPLEQNTKNTDFIQTSDSDSLWSKLREIDPKRAEQLHPNDIYRISRALNIWYSTQTLPSECEPKFTAPFNFIFIFLNPPREKLYERINLRTRQLLGSPKNSAWVDEVKPLINTGWEEFLNTKGLIGYRNIIEWVKRGSLEEEFQELTLEIQKETRNYAKRQVTFWKSFSDSLTKNRNSSPFNYTILTLDKIDEESLNHVINLIKSNL
jgi:tRNA dimethylallyltransferase